MKPSPLFIALLTSSLSEHNLFLLTLLSTQQAWSNTENNLCKNKSFHLNKAGEMYVHTNSAIHLK